jgi:hypothetical protein
LAASALASATALSHTATSFSVHEVFLPVDAMDSLEPTACMPAAARHGKGAAFQVATQPSLDDLVQIAGHEGNDPDAVGGNHLLQRPGDRAAN